MRVLYFGTYRAEYSRNQIMIEGLRRAGVEVIECNQMLWTSIADRVQAASGGWRSLGFVSRVIRTYWRLLQKYRQVGDYDLMVVGYPGQFDVFLARLLASRRKKPLVWDVFMSIYLIALERGLHHRSRFTIEVIRRIERLACSIPDRLILDTSEYVTWFCRTHDLDPERFRLVPTGADDRQHQPAQNPPDPDPTAPFRVLYYGTYIPNHGVEWIIAAARLLSDHPEIQFELIGDGPDKPKVQQMAQEYQLKNVTFIDWLEKEALVQRAACADLCLGVFGVTPQSLMTVQNKIYEGLAMARPVLSGDAPAVRQALTQGQHLWLCKRQDGQALADAILTLQADPDLRSVLAARGYEIFKQKYDLLHIGRLYASHLSELLKA